MSKDANGKDLPKGITWRENDKLYMARFTYQGYSYAFYDTDLKAAQKKMNDKKYEVVHGICGKADKISLDTWFDIWLSKYKIHTVKETTLATYENIYKNHIKECLGKRQLTQIKPIHIQMMYNDFLESGLSTKYLSLVNSLLYNIMEIAVKNDLIIKNPCIGVIMPKVIQKKQRVLSQEEQSLLLDYLSKDKWRFHRALIITLLGTGIRIGEALSLTWMDIDFKQKQISINKTLIYIKDKVTKVSTFKNQSPKSVSSVRTIPMHIDVEKALKQQFKSQRELLPEYMGGDWKPLEGFENLVFTGYTGKPKQDNDVLNALNNIVKAINDDEIIKAKEEQREPIEFEHIHPHCFRHTFATRCFEQEIPMKTVQLFLGHSSIKMTMDLYTHVSEEKKKEDMKKLKVVFKAVNE